MIITKKIERLYALKQYENIKIVYEATEDIGDIDPNVGYEKLSNILYEQIKKDAEIIKQGNQQ